jgi:hypothetical protein
MNCKSCGLPLSPGAAFCTSCGAATPYNTPGQNSSSPYDPAPAASSPYNPTIMADPSPYNPTVMASPPSYDPTIAAPSPYGQPGQQPPTSYGAPPNPYENLPAQDPYNPYNAASSPYAAPPPQPNAYPAYGYGNPPAIPGTYMPGTPPGAYGTAKSSKRNRTGLIIGLSVLALVLVCGLLGAALVALSKNASQTNKSTSTTTATTTSSTTATMGSVPSTSSIVPSAAAIIFHPQTASAIDKGFLPTQVTSTFTVNQTVYLTFSIDSKGQDGYVQVKWYEDGQLLDAPILHHHAQNDHAYFSLPYDQAGSGAAAMYWCTQSNCSDAQLAQVVTFTVTS